jgi:hypothetical protein
LQIIARYAEVRFVPQGLLASSCRFLVAAETVVVGADVVPCFRRSRVESQARLSPVVGLSLIVSAANAKVTKTCVALKMSVGAPVTRSNRQNPVSPNAGNIRYFKKRGPNEKFVSNAASTARSARYSLQAQRDYQRISRHDDGAG